MLLSFTSAGADKNPKKKKSSRADFGLTHSDAKVQQPPNRARPTSEYTRSQPYYAITVKQYSRNDAFILQNPETSLFWNCVRVTILIPPTLALVNVPVSSVDVLLALC